MEVEDLVGRHRERAVDHLLHRGVLVLDLGALAGAQRVHVQDERLLDLGVVEEVAAALRGDLRVIGEHDRPADHHVVVRRGEDRPGVHAVARSVQL
jgi:hypothetical protein